MRTQRIENLGPELPLQFGGEETKMPRTRKELTEAILKKRFSGEPLDPEEIAEYERQKAEDEEDKQTEIKRIYYGGSRH